MLKISVLVACLLSFTNASMHLTSICDRYTTILRKDAGGNTKANQELVLQLLVNTAVAGNLDFTLEGTLFEASKTPLNADVILGKNATTALNVPVPGILNLNGSGTLTMADGSIYTGDLLKFFTGKEMTTNVGGNPAMVNFIDIGVGPFATGPAFDYTPEQMISKQFLLMQHLYQIFSQLLGCSMGYPEYSGNPGMWTKHRFMKLTNTENLYFITQVGAAARSYGVSEEDITKAATALINIYNRKNAPAFGLKPAAGLTSALQSCCQGPTCKMSPNPNPITTGAPDPIAYIVAANPGISICDKYTTALLTDNTQGNQEAVLQLLVNTAVAGNLDFTLEGTFWGASKSPLNADVALNKSVANSLNVRVPGILNLNGTGTFLMLDGTTYTGDLAKFFLGLEMTTNVGGSPGMVNFIDIGPLPLATGPSFMYTPEQMISKQFLLMQHLYQIFSQLLGCSKGFPAYSGNVNMWSKHRFMELTNVQNMYFISQVGAAAKSYGVTDADAGAVGMALVNIFNRKNSPAYAIAPPAGLTSALQSCCQGPTCIMSPNPNPTTGGNADAQAYIDAQAVGAVSRTAVTQVILGISKVIAEDPKFLIAVTIALTASLNLGPGNFVTEVAVTFVDTAARKLLAPSASVDYVVTGSASASAVKDAIAGTTLAGSTNLGTNLASPAPGSGQSSYPGATPQAAQTSDASPTMAPTMMTTDSTIKSSAGTVQSSLLLTASIVAVALFL